MALGNNHLMQLEPWYDLWLLPCFQAYYRADCAALGMLLAAAEEQLGLENFTADERQALRYELCALRYYLSTLHLPTEHYVEEVHQALLLLVQRVSEPAQGELSRSVQAYWLIAACGMGVRRGYFDLPERRYCLEFEKLLPQQRTQLLWFFVAIRAYYRNDLHFLTLAAEAHSTEPTGFRDSFFWGSSRLMFRLVSAEATSRDLVDFIRSFEHPNALRDFENLFRERAAAAGLIDSEVEDELAKATARLAGLEGTFPQPFRRTGGMLANKALYSLAGLKK